MFRKSSFSGLKCGSGGIETSFLLGGRDTWSTQNQARRNSEDVNSLLFRGKVSIRTHSSHDVANLLKFRKKGVRSRCGVLQLLRSRLQRFLISRVESGAHSQSPRRRNVPLDARADVKHLTRRHSEPLELFQ